MLIFLILVKNSQKTGFFHQKVIKGKIQLYSELPEEQGYFIFVYRVQINSEVMWFWMERCVDAGECDNRECVTYSDAEV